MISGVFLCARQTALVRMVGVFLYNNIYSTENYYCHLRLLSVIDVLLNGDIYDLASKGASQLVTRSTRHTDFSVTS